jgi:hypothetical protein
MLRDLIYGAWTESKPAQDRQYRPAPASAKTSSGV